tara:strand:+ start:134 stop:307 length:174 start_codon:yes stop_codon:yes gene_type:complete
MIYSDKEKTKLVNIKQNAKGFYNLHGEIKVYGNDNAIIHSYCCKNNKEKTNPKKGDD